MAQITKIYFAFMQGVNLLIKYVGSKGKVTPGSIIISQMPGLFAQFWVFSRCSKMNVFLPHEMIFDAVCTRFVPLLRVFHRVFEQV